VGFFILEKGPVTPGELTDRFRKAIDESMDVLRELAVKTAPPSKMKRSATRKLKQAA
jgi:hypothetical protein